MYQLFQDSMAICWHCQKPDLFLTMTANSNWPEIQQALLELDCPIGDNPNNPPKQQTAADRPDIVAQVFNQKKNALLKEIKNGLFGTLAGMVYTIESQKCSLPHMHLLIFLNSNYKISNAQHVDRIVFAQIPDSDTYSMLYNAITKLMTHGPCSSEKPHILCMVDGKCSKCYYKDFVPETLYGKDGYPQYARPNNRCTCLLSGTVMDNLDVVPYSPYLLAKYDCHINVEICALVKAIKYIHKYIYKGHNCATLEVVEGVDEIKEYVDAQYIGPIEACWHIFKFGMHLELPTVYQLPVHLQDNQQVFFDSENNAVVVLDYSASKKTQLTEWC